MKTSEIEPPSNKAFGFFFAFIFAVVAAYFCVTENETLSYTLAVSAAVLSGIAVINAEVLSPLNSLWTRFGLLLGAVVGPVVLGFIFFGIFTPIAVAMRLAGRDELKLKFIPKKGSHWIIRNEKLKSDSFENQF